MLHNKAVYVLHLLLAATQIKPSSQIPGQLVMSVESRYPKRTIAGVSVVDTPIVRAAREFARNHSSDFLYKHVMRGWLFGALIIEHNETLRSTVDLEVHAVSALLHDLGWDRTPNSPFISKDRRFEVDGAIAAREFVKDSNYGKHWDEERTQLVWDSIALHTMPSIARYKQHEVAVTSSGIVVDFEGPAHGITRKEYDAVVSEFPHDDLISGVNDTLVWLCYSKPATTYDTWMQPFGEHFVSNYSAIGKRFFDILQQPKKE